MKLNYDKGIHFKVFINKKRISSIWRFPISVLQIVFLYSVTPSTTWILLMYIFKIYWMSSYLVFWLVLYSWKLWKGLMALFQRQIFLDSRTFLFEKNVPNLFTMPPKSSKQQTINSTQQIIYLLAKEMFFSFQQKFATGMKIVGCLIESLLNYQKKLLS